MMHGNGMSIAIQACAVVAIQDPRANSHPFFAGAILLIIGFAAWRFDSTEAGQAGNNLCSGLIGFHAPHFTLADGAKRRQACLALPNFSQACVAIVRSHIRSMLLPCPLRARALCLVVSRFAEWVDQHVIRLREGVDEELVLFWVLFEQFE